jgi:asparagine synthase (glutamine-hydrolysing)
VYDEADEQDEVVGYLSTDHHRIACDYQAIADNFTKVIWHTETPILRTAPTPLFLLSGLVRQHAYKVVLTGEGADEILGGYDIFKEAKVRAFIGRQANSSCRPLLLKRLYPYLALSPTKSAAFAKQFFDTEASVADNLFYGHGPRWKTGEFLSRFLSEDLVRPNYNPVSRFEERYGAILSGMDFFSRAQYVECKMLLANYLLSSQGDRMAMGNSIEGRFPFLDHRVVEFACTLPLRLRMKGLNEKYLLKQTMQDILPPAIVQRKKQPYMAPDILSFFGAKESVCVERYLSEEVIRKSGIFAPTAVSGLVNKCRKKARQGFRENMALVGVLSTQILHEQYISNFDVVVPDQLPNIQLTT